MTLSPPTPSNPRPNPTSTSVTPLHRASTHVVSTPPTQPLSPILARRAQNTTPLSASEPQYAEDLTPLKLRRRRRNVPTASAGPSSFPLTLGLSTQGYTTEEGDTYRGARYDPRLGAPPIDDDAVTLGGSSTTSSSSSWSWASDIQRGRRATMAVIERLGEKMGVRRGSSASDESITDSSKAETVSVKRKRSRRLSRTTTKNTSPERPKRQQAPLRREFTLILPPKTPLHLDLPTKTTTPASSLHSEDLPPPSYSPDRVISTPSLPVILDRIRALRAATGILPQSPGPEVAVKKGRSAPGRPRPKMHQTPGFFFAPPVPRPQVPRTRSRVETLRRSSALDVPRPKSVSDLMGMVNPYGSSTSLSGLRTPEETPSGASTPSVSKDETKTSNDGCWWLDVSCPGWEDLRDIGELLGLHPLTLEDVLQQDPREKFDIFDRLGYYFMVVRALDEEYFKYTPGASSTLVGSGEKAVIDTPTGSPQLRADTEKSKEGRRRGWGMGRATGKSAIKEGDKVEIVEDPGKEGLEGVGVGAINVYLVVFADGVLSFHYGDITKHTKRVMDKILSETRVHEAPGADWIAHGLLDSIVDAFFPLIRFIDGEVDDIDSLTIDPSTDPKARLKPELANKPNGVELDEKGIVMPLPPPPVPYHTIAWRKFQRAIAFPSISLPRPLVYIRLFLLPTSETVRQHYEHPDNLVVPRSDMVKHMTHMRKLVTGLARLLGTKHQVVNLLRKRVTETGEGVDAYVGDVEDHILLLQNSLYHYEFILAHCQPAYISHVHLSSKISRDRSDQVILALSAITIGILPMQLVISVVSCNVNVPMNIHAAGHPFNWFIGVVVLDILIGFVMVTIVRYWRWTARVKWAKKRGEKLPSTWDGFWGFR